MNLVDVNVLIYAVNSDSPHHDKARAWLETALSGVEVLGLTWTVLLAFLRVTTRHAMQKPLDVTAAIAYVDSWLRQPNVQIVEPGEDHWLILRALLSSTGTAGNLTFANQGDSGSCRPKTGSVKGENNESEDSKNSIPGSYQEESSVT